jgi:hypothetical protein
VEEPVPGDQVRILAVNGLALEVEGPQSRPGPN